MKRMVDESLLKQNSILKYGKEILGYRDPVYIKFVSPSNGLNLSANEDPNVNMYTHFDSSLGTLIMLFDYENLDIGDVLISIEDAEPDFIFYFLPTHILNNNIYGRVKVMESGTIQYDGDTLFNKGWITYPGKIYTLQAFSDGLLGNKISKFQLSIENLSTHYIESNIEGVVKRYSVTEFVDYVNQII